MRLAAAIAGITAIAALLLSGARPAKVRPLWPGSRFTEADRDRALRRGVLFLRAMSMRPDVFQEWGHDLLGAFCNIAETSADPQLRRLAWDIGHERAVAWRRLHPKVPSNPTVGDLIDSVFAGDSADSLGVPDPAMKEAVRTGAARYAAADFLQFDPKLGPPSGVTRKRAYFVYQNALILTYSFDRYGVTLGAHFPDVLRLLPAMHPYPPYHKDDFLFYNAVYAATHVIYTYNDYSRSRISRSCFPEEFAFLAANLHTAIDENDPETVGEYLDSLRAFGLTLNDPLIRTGFDYLLRTQNSDGSWDDVNEPDLYARYHPTWTAIDGLREYNWTRVLPCPAF
jgi:hypothetical protein